MVDYLKHLLHLFVSPGAGWEHLAEGGASVRETDRRGFYPWLALTALTQLLPLAYGRPLSVVAAIERTLLVAAAMYASLLLARVVLDMWLPRYVEGGSVDGGRVGVFTAYMLGIDCLFRIVENALPVPLTFLMFLPLLAVSTVFNGASYLGVRQDDVLSFTFVGIIATIVVPIFLTAVLLLFV